MTPLPLLTRTPRAYTAETATVDDAAPNVRGQLSKQPSRARGWRTFKRLTELGFPRRFPIVQFPNAPLIVAFLAGEVSKHTHGSAHAYGWAVSFLALGIWAYLELVEGVNWFRRLLGLAYVVSTTMHLALALQ